LENLGSPLIAALLLTFTGFDSLVALAAVWVLLGVGLSLVQTPIGRVLTRIASPEERTSLFAAQFSVSHGAWLVAYPVAGALGVVLGVTGASAVLGAAAAGTVAAALILWPRDLPTASPST
ncbi:MAG: MFS transporter, partial [Solirubrobacterales bacterium]